MELTYSGVSSTDPKAPWEPSTPRAAILLLQDIDSRSSCGRARVTGFRPDNSVPIVVVPPPPWYIRGLYLEQVLWSGHFRVLGARQKSHRSVLA